MEKHFSTHASEVISLEYAESIIPYLLFIYPELMIGNCKYLCQIIFMLPIFDLIKNRETNGYE